MEQTTTGVLDSSIDLADSYPLSFRFVVDIIGIFHKLHAVALAVIIELLRMPQLARSGRPQPILQRYDNDLP